MDRSFKGRLVWTYTGKTSWFGLWKDKRPEVHILNTYNNQILKHIIKLEIWDKECYVNMGKRITASLIKEHNIEKDISQLHEEVQSIMFKWSSEVGLYDN